MPFCRDLEAAIAARAQLGAQIEETLDTLAHARNAAFEGYSQGGSAGVHGQRSEQQDVGRQESEAAQARGDSWGRASDSWGKPGGSSNVSGQGVQGITSGHAAAALEGKRGRRRGGGQAMERMSHAGQAGEGSVCHTQGGSSRSSSSTDGANSCFQQSPRSGAHYEDSTATSDGWEGERLVRLERLKRAGPNKRKGLRLDSSREVGEVSLKSRRQSSRRVFAGT